MDAEATTWSDEEFFRKDHPILWLVTLVGPFLLTAIILVLIEQISDDAMAWKIVSTAVVTFFFFGKFVILGGIDETDTESVGFFSAEQLFGMVFYMDVVTSCLLAFHLGFLFRLPFIGSRLRLLVEDGHFILQSNPWMKRLTIIGLVVFVMFPLAATGSVGGSIFGRLLGLSRKATFVGITLGNLLGCLLMYFGSEMITRYVGRDNPLLLIGGIVVVSACIVLLNRRYQKLKQASRMR